MRQFFIYLLIKQLKLTLNIINLFFKLQIEYPNANKTDYGTDIHSDDCPQINSKNAHGKSDTHNICKCHA